MALRSATPAHETDSITSANPLQVNVAQVHDLDVVRLLRAASAHQRRRTARARDLSVLLRRRPDLAGVHDPADLIVDAVLWGV